MIVKIEIGRFSISVSNDEGEPGMLWVKNENSDKEVLILESDLEDALEKLFDTKSK